MNNTEYRLLFICTHNRCRSILFEALFNDMARQKNTPYQAFSAGSAPAGEVHPLTLKHLQRQGIATNDLRSKSCDEFENNPPHIVITVCDRAASEPCPVWFGNQVKLHWGLADPSAIDPETDEAASDKAFQETIEQIRSRSEALIAALNTFGTDKAALSAADLEKRLELITA